ncbi:hypothetical protein ACJMK2_040314 [Sinanodonta woodiana]|uniref:Death domain-containing protein n=1 Tax=Sinanodonta woodiana TaxID=1069815 RepID=A0ABD3WFT7_SINWO
MPPNYQDRNHFIGLRAPSSRETEYKFISDTVNDICMEIKTYAKEHFSKRKINYDACANCLRELCNKWNWQPSKTETWKDLLEKTKVKNVDNFTKDDVNDLVGLCERSRVFESLIPQLRERLVTCLKEHVHKYCVSFVEEAEGVDARPVHEYEEAIRSYQKDINIKVDSMNADILKYGELKTPLEKFIEDGASVGTLMEEICIQIVEISHVLKTWASDDAAYPDKLEQEVFFNNSYKEKLHDDVVKLKKRSSSLSKSLERKQKFTSKLEKEYLSFRREKIKLKNSLQTVCGKIEKFQRQIDNMNGEIEDAKEMLTNKRMITPRQQVDMQLKLHSDLNEYERLFERLEVMERQKMRLERDLKEVSDRTYELKVEVITNRHDQEEINQSLVGMDLEEKSLRDRIDAIDRKTNVIKNIRVLKISPETLRKLHRRRREYQQHGQLNDACHFVAQFIGDDWKKLYIKLPFVPVRDNSKRQHDVEIIDMIAGRRDKTIPEQALKSLEKWRVFNRRHADISQLVRSLRQLNKLELAQKVETKFVDASAYG